MGGNTAQQAGPGASPLAFHTEGLYLSPAVFEWWGGALISHEDRHTAEAIGSSPFAAVLQFGAWGLGPGWPR